MPPREWALVVFTVLAQLSVGAWLSACAAHALLSRGIGLEAASRLIAPAAAGCAGVFAVSLAASIFHLGAPSGAPLALGNLSHSWLSREILAAVLFLGALIASSAGLRWRPGEPWAAAGLGAIAALAGAALVLSMARVYRLAAQPAWDSILTPASFLLTTAALGGAVAAAWMLWRWPGAVPPGTAPLAWHRLVAQLASAFSVVAAVALGLELVVAPLAAMASGGGGAGSAGLPALLAGPAAWLLATRLALVLSGAALLLVTAYRLATAAWAQVPPGLGLVIVLVVLAEETAGRLLFYQLRSGLGL